MRYAADTSVSAEKSRSEIETCVRRYGASGFISGWKGNDAMITFEIRDRRIRFMLPLPDRQEKRFWYTPARHNRRSDAEAYREWEQACRQKWRALALAVKAKLEAVESRISTFEQEFLAHIVLPTGLTLGETIIPRLTDIIATGRMPPLLPGIGETTAQ